MLKSSEHIGPAEIGLLATVGVTTVKVNKSFSYPVTECRRESRTTDHFEYESAGISSTNHCCIFYRG